jgi:hypothetical protein
MGHVVLAVSRFSFAFLYLSRAVLKIVVLFVAEHGR